MVIRWFRRVPMVDPRFMLCAAALRPGTLPVHTRGIGPVPFAGTQRLAANGPTGMLCHAKNFSLSGTKGLVPALPSGVLAADRATTFPDGFPVGSVLRSIFLPERPVRTGAQDGCSPGILWMVA
jgi:hypothetical protein